MARSDGADDGLGQAVMAHVVLEVAPLDLSDLASVTDVRAIEERVRAVLLYVAGAWVVFFLFFLT